MERARKLILSMIIIFMATPLYAVDTAAPMVHCPLPMPIISHTECTSFCDWVNIAKINAKNIDIKDDADILREQWKEALGVDIFYAHFKAKEITHKIEEKSNFKLFNMRGKATIKEDSAIYTFSHKF